MEVFRISTAKRAKSLSASGAENRWNVDGQYVIYTGSSRSLSSLELVVHSNAIRPKVDYKVMIIHLDDHSHLYHEIKVANLPPNWRLRAAYSALQAIGADWYINKTSLILKVPSAVIPIEYNFVINLEHPDFKNHVRLIAVEDYFWDERILKRR